MQCVADREVLTVPEAAAHFGLPAWKLRRLFERGLGGKPARLGAWRVLRRDELPDLEVKLRAAGYLRDPEQDEDAEPVTPADDSSTSAPTWQQKYAEQLDSLRRRLRESHGLADRVELARLIRVKVENEAAFDAWKSSLPTEEVVSR